MATENDVSVVAPSTPHIIKKDSSSDGAVKAEEEKKVPLVVASTTKISPQITQQSTENQETVAGPNFSSAQKNPENSIQSDSGLSNKRTLETTNISESGSNKKVCTVENRESSVVSQEKREFSCGNDVSVKTEKTEHIAPKTASQPIAQNMDTVANNNNKIVNINTKEKANKNNTSVKATGGSSSTGSNKKVSTPSTSGNNGNKDANQSIESILAGIKDECSADMTVVKTVHCTLNLLQTYGPLTYDQLDFNLPPECVKSPGGRLQQIIDILMLTGTISIFDESCTENLENDRGMLYEEKKKVNKNTSPQKEQKGAPSMLDKNVALSRIVSSDTKTETKAITTCTSSSEENKATPPISKDDDQNKNAEPAKSQNVDGAPSIVPVWIKDMSFVAQPSEDKKIKIENSSTEATKNNTSVSDNTSSKDSENIVNKNNATNKSKDEKPEEINQKSCIDKQSNSSLTTKELEKPISVQTSTTASTVSEQGKPVVVGQESPPKKPVLAKVDTKVKDENLDLKEFSGKEASVAVKARKYMFADGKFYHCAQNNIISLSNGISERGTTTNNNTNGVSNMSSDNNLSRSMNDKSNSGITRSSPVLLLPQLLPELECARVETEESKERIDILRHALEVKPTSVRKDNAIKIKLENGFETKSSEISEILDKVRNEESVGELIHYLVAKYPSLSSDPIYSSALKHF